MGPCSCGYTTDPAGSCNGTHKAVKRVKQDVQDKLTSNCLWNKPEQLDCECSWHIAASTLRKR